MQMMKCERCGKEIEKRWVRKYCAKCRKVVDYEQAKRYCENHKRK